jgi:hypothetical protein
MTSEREEARPKAAAKAKQKAKPQSPPTKRDLVILGVVLTPEQKKRYFFKKI